MRRYPSKGVFASLGGNVTVKVDIRPNPEQIKSQLMRAASNLEDTTKPMLASKRVAQEDIQAHFNSQSSPAGESWMELDETYLRYKESQGGAPEILKWSGELEKAAVSDEAFIVTPNGLWYNWDALPKIDWKNSEGGEGNLGILHQTGTGLETGKITFTTESKETITKEVRFSIGVGRGKALPARPFVGMSNFMEESFVEIFDSWADEAFAVVVNPKTGVMQEHGISGIDPTTGKRFGGRFGKRIGI